MPETTKDLAAAVAVVFSHLTDRGAEEFERLCLTENLLYRCVHCGHNIDVDSTHQPCEHCGENPMEDDDA